MRATDFTCAWKLDRQKTALHVEVRSSKVKVIVGPPSDCHSSGLLGLDSHFRGWGHGDNSQFIHAQIFISVSLRQAVLGVIKRKDVC